jgi:hypothetical protein
MLTRGLGKNTEGDALPPRAVDEALAGAELTLAVEVQGDPDARIDVADASRRSVQQDSQVGLEPIAQNRGSSDLEECGHGTRRSSVGDTDARSRGSFNGRAERGRNPAFGKTGLQAQVSPDASRTPERSKF